MQPTIEVEGLAKTYPGGIEAVKGVDFEVAAGEVFGLLGPNGAGKSTTIGMLTTTIEPTAGTARLADRVASVHEGSIVAYDTPARLLAGLGREIVELRVDGDGAAALSLLRSRGIANGDSFVVGSTLTVPLRDLASHDAIASIAD